MNRKIYEHIANIAYQINKSSSEYWKDIWEQDLEHLERNYLPSGSGFDAGCSINLVETKVNRLVIDFDYHHMDQNGYYNGWSHNQLILTASLVWDFDIRIVNRKGGHRIQSYDRDYFIDVFNYALNQELDITELFNKSRNN
jgi:hypothetical protein